MERAKRRRLIGWGIAIGSIALIVFVAFFSPLLDVRNVEVVGSRHVSPRDIALVANLGPDDNLLTTSTVEIAARAEQLPWVKHAKVARRLPGTIRVKIEERTPALLLKTTDGAATVDGRGRVLEHGSAAKGLVTLSGSAAPAPAPGERLSTPELVGAVRVWRGLPKRVRTKTDAIFAPTVERISLALEGGTIVRYGAPEAVRAKNSVLRALLPRSAGASYIDVRVPTSPAVGPALPGALETPAPR